MSQILSLLQGSLLLHNSSFYDRPFDSSTLLPQKSCLYYGHYTKFQQCRGLKSSLQGSWETIDSTEKCSTHSKAKVCDGDELNAFSHVQTLRKFPVEQLFGKVVMVRIDSTLLLRQALESNTPSVERACFTLKYLYRAGAKVVIAGNWGQPSDSMRLLSAETAADFLSSVLQLKVVPTNWISDYKQYKMEDLEKADILLLENLSQFKEELANCSEFARKLSSGVDIFVNDNFSQSHKILASTVGVSRHCHASIAGFCFEEELSQVMEVTKTTKQPYIAIIGGGNLFDKAAAVHLLASKCDGLVFVGMMAFQIMHALGVHVPLSFVDCGAVEDSFKIIQLARERNIPLLFPKDFWCMNDSLGEQFDVFPGHEILDGWTPVDLGPISLNEISFLLSKCKKILWIGPVKFRLSQPDTQGTSKLAVMLETSSRKGCDVTVVGNAACKAIMRSSNNFSCYSLYENASAVWEFLKGRMLPGLSTLDRDGEWEEFVITLCWTHSGHPRGLRFPSFNRSNNTNLFGKKLTWSSNYNCRTYLLDGYKKWDKQC